MVVERGGKMNVVQKRQVAKFSFYGFLKNLKFFEPFLIVYLLQNELSLFHIGLMYSVREVIIYIFEIPSGVFADRFGKKNELILCFLFYIGSFVMFFIGGDVIVFVFAFILYGFGEALRSGTHKAMIMDYLDHEDLGVSKGKIYGKTRSYSLIGSMISSILAIILLFVVDEVRYLFLIAIIPYLIDIYLIMSYPSYMNQKRDSEFSLKKFLTDNLNVIRYSIFDKEARGLLVSSSSFGAWFKVIKDYIQPIIIVSSIGLLAQSNIELEMQNKIYLALIYAVVYYISSLGSKNAYKFKKIATKEVITTLVWIPAGLIVLMVGLFVQQVIVVTVMFILIYLLLNIRKPLMIELIGDTVQKEKRASVLSVESQMTSIFMIVLAPLLGYLSDTYSIGTMFILMGLFIILFEIGKVVIAFLIKQKDIVTSK